MANRQRGHRSKDNYIPGQMSMDIDEFGGFSGFKEKKFCSAGAARSYWEKFDNFLDHSGRVSRVWHLYKAIKGDPLLADIAQMPEGPEKDAAMASTQKHFSVMTDKYKCNTPEELYKKAEREYRQYRYSYDSLILAARQANVDPNIRGDYIRRFLDAFVIISDCYQGDIRRDFYRKHYVRPALDTLAKNPEAFVEPIDIRVIEKDFEKADKFKASFIRKREKNKERLRKKNESAKSPAPG